MTPGDEQVHAAIARQAGEWFAAIEDGPLEEGERVALTAWLRASPLHVKEFLGVAVIAGDLPAAADDPDVPMESLLEQARKDDADGVVVLDHAQRSDELPLKRLGVPRAWALAATAAGVVVLAASMIWRAHDGELLGLPKTYETAHGEQAAWRLPDGSVLHLNTDAVATVHYSGEERVVDVHRGQAYFEVARGSQRRFRVAAGEAQVLAVGTEFDVYRQRDRTLVTVVEGTVTVSAGEPPLPSAAVPPLPSLRVDAGQQAGVEAGKLWAGTKPVDAKAAVAWLHRQIVVQDRPLGEVAEEYNRYARVTIVIEDAALRALRVSGRFDAYDTESFAAFLESLDGVSVERTATRIRVLRLPAARSEEPPSAR